jgi:hypothetical protein
MTRRRRRGCTGRRLTRATQERLYQLAKRALPGHSLTCTIIGTLHDVIAGPLYGTTATAVALERICDTVYGLNRPCSTPWGQRQRCSRASRVELAGRLGVTSDIGDSACCVGYGATRKLKTCSKCGIVRFCDMNGAPSAYVGLWPARARGELGKHCSKLAA